MIPRFRSDLIDRGHLACLLEFVSQWLDARGMTPECEDLVKLMQINAKSEPASLFELYNENAASKIGIHMVAGARLERNRPRLPVRTRPGCWVSLTISVASKRGRLRTVGKRDAWALVFK